MTLLLYFAVFFSTFQVVPGQTPGPRPPECKDAKVNERDVARHVFRTYASPIYRPRRNAQDTVKIEKNQVIRVSAYLALRWFDEFHIWNTSFPHYCVPYLVLPSTKLWLPDVAEMNDPRGRYAIMMTEGEKIRLHSNGFTTFSPGGTFEAQCDFDFTLFPWDSQACSIVFESWRYTNNYVSFKIGHPTKIYQWMENDQWTLLGTSEKLISEKYTFDEMSFDRIEFYVYLKRKSRYYQLNILLPSGIIAIAQISVFALPLGEPSKIEVSFTCLLAYSVFQVMVAEDMPRSSDRVPYVSIFIHLKMLYLALCMLGEGVVFLMLYQAENYRQMPAFLYSIFQFLGRGVLLNGHGFNDEFYPRKPKRPKILLAAPAVPVASPSLPPPTVAKRLNSEEDSIYDRIGPRHGHRGDDMYDEIDENCLHRQKAKISLDTSKVTSHHNEAPNHETALIWRKRWIFAAMVTERITGCMYILSILITHGIILLISQIQSYSVSQSFKQNSNN